MIVNRIILLFILMSAMACSPEKKSGTAQTTVSETEPSSPAEPKKNIVFFGNSLTAGYGLDISEAFPARIQEIMDSLEMPYEVINAGLSGETTASGNSRVNWVLKNNVDVFVLELGANDGLRGIPTTETESNLQEIIDKVLAKYPEARIVLTGMLVPPNMGETYANDFRDIFLALAEKNQIALVPFLLEGVAGEPELNLEDGIHPTNYGHHLVANNVWQVLKDIL